MLDYDLEKTMEFIQLLGQIDAIRNRNVKKYWELRAFILDKLISLVEEGANPNAKPENSKIVLLDLLVYEAMDKCNTYCPIIEKLVKDYGLDLNQVHVYNNKAGGRKELTNLFYTVVAAQYKELAFLFLKLGARDPSAIRLIKEALPKLDVADKERYDRIMKSEVDKEIRDKLTRFSLSKSTSTSPSTSPYLFASPTVTPSSSPTIPSSPSPSSSFTEENESSKPKRSFSG